MNEKKVEQGWGFPLRSRKAHYFNKSVTSLCGKWMYSGLLFDTNDDSPDNCTSCKKAVLKLRAEKSLEKLKKEGKIEI